MSTMVSYVSRRFLSSSGKDAAKKHILKKGIRAGRTNDDDRCPMCHKTEYEILRTFASKTKASIKKQNVPFPIEGGIRRPLTDYIDPTDVGMGFLVSILISKKDSAEMKKSG